MGKNKERHPTRGMTSRFHTKAEMRQYKRAQEELILSLSWWGTVWQEERKLDRKYRKRDRKSRDERSHRRGRDQKRSRRDYSDDEEEDMEPYHEMKDKIEENLKEMGERRALDYVRVFFKKYLEHNTTTWSSNSSTLS